MTTPPRPVKKAVTKRVPPAPASDSNLQAQLEEATRKLDHATVVLANIVTILRLPRPEPWQVAQIREVMDRWLPGE